MSPLATAPPRSTFVNVVGWIFLAFSAFGFLIGVLQNIMLHTVFPQDAFTQIASHPQHPELPAISKWMIRNMALVFAFVPAVGLVQLVAAIGLLRRRNWARLLFIALMVLGIVSTLGGSVFQGVMMIQMHEEFSVMQAARPGEMPDLGWFMVGMWVFSLVMALAFVALYAWIIKRLLSPAVVAEFRV